MALNSLMDVMKSYVALACVAFMVGFVGYWILGQASASDQPPVDPAYQAPVSAPSPVADFNRGKRI